MKRGVVLFVVISGIVCTAANAQSTRFSQYLGVFIPPEQASFRSCKFEGACDSETECRQLRNCEQVPNTEKKCSVEFISKNLGFGMKTKIPIVKCLTIPSRAFAACKTEAERQKKECLLKRKTSVLQCTAQVEIEEARCGELKEQEITFAAGTSQKIREFSADLKRMDYKSLPKSQIDILAQIFGENIIDKIRVIKTHNENLFSKIFFSDVDSIPWSNLPEALRIEKFQDSPFVIIENYVITPPDWSGDFNIYQSIYIILTVEIFYKFGIDKYYELDVFSPDTISIYALSQAENICKTRLKVCE